MNPAPPVTNTLFALGTVPKVTGGEDSSQISGPDFSLAPATSF
jgi:hypothetical protein